ncbi:HAD-IIA family hydrolase [Acetobacterium wieringae]|uniref:HAD-IIA family hydrolase n=1 Tax=Acetobacterium wieringae TaxID=52694 RepID=UPI002B1FED42|nr:HAD-IIA family hydrolase [Acetobacterium wieringae]MEA4806982.1 HAD-IIA family hydrolase [Acetobacterium wieringae]
MMLSKEEALKDVKLFALDMDGTFYLGNGLIDGALDFIEALRSHQKDFIFITNNSSRGPSFYQEKLKKMGCFVEADRIITSGDVTINYLKTFYPGQSVYLMGTPLLEESFKKHGIKLVQEQPDVAVASFDTTLTYEKLKKICTFINNGAVFLSTHLDLVCPTETGFIPDCGAMCALITKSTGVEPKYLGKPFPETMEMILATTGHKKEDVAFVGDRIYTDVATGVNNGGKGFLVLTGETKMVDVASSAVVPDCVFDSLKEMTNYL